MLDWFFNRFDDEEHEYELRFGTWRMKWFPYRTIEFLGWDKEKNEIKWGDSRWHKPNIFLRKNDVS